MSIKITTLIENMTTKEELIPEHGLSLVVEKDGFKVLFDTGSTGQFMDNAKNLDIDLEEIDTVILSHNHYDHARGFVPFVKQRKNPLKLYISDGFFTSKYWDHEEGFLEFIGPPFDGPWLLRNFVDTEIVKRGVQEVFEGSGIYMIRNFSKLCDYEDIDPASAMEYGGKIVTDTFPDEIVLAIPTEKGIVVITGCAHNGIVNICKTIKSIFSQNIYAIFGGTHLVVADEERIHKTLDFVRSEGIKISGVCHCTGEIGLPIFEQECETFFKLNTGTVFFE